MKFGAVGDGVHDDTSAIKTALSELLHVCFPSGVFKISAPIRLKDGQILSGTGISQALTTAQTGSTKLLFSGGEHSGSAIMGLKEDTSIQHVHIKDLSIHVADPYDWVIDFKNPIGCDFTNIEIASRNNITGGIRTTKNQEFSWVNNFMNVQIKLPNLSNAHNLDLSHGDFHIIGGNFSGGIGAIVGGTGGDRIIGARFDNAGMHPAYNKFDPSSPRHPMREKSAGLTIKAATQYRQPIVSSCQIENNGMYDLVVDADTPSIDNMDLQALPIITDNLFRSFHAEASIYLKNKTGKPVTGGIIQGNSFNSENTYLLIDKSRWNGIVIGPNRYRRGKHAKLPVLSGNSTWLDEVGINLPHGNLRVGEGSPSGKVAAEVGTLYLNLEGGSNRTLYVKEIGSDKNGWVAK